MSNIKEFNTRLLMENLENHLKQFHYGEYPVELYQPISYIMNLGGKRIRPLLTLLAYSLYKQDYKSILTPATAIEVFHNFTLMHDDIMDKAPLRRGEQTVHEKWNANTAILSGDVMLVKAYDMLLEIDPIILPSILKKFNKTAAEVCEGQQLDMTFEQLEDVSEHDYIEMIKLKTAVLLGFSLEFGALLAGASDHDAQSLYNFGVNIGIGFQLKDDLLDVYADKAKFGKQVGGDIMSNKKTFLLIKAKELANSHQKLLLSSFMKMQAVDNEKKVKEVTAIYDELNIKPLTEKKMASYFQNGFDQLSAIQVNNPAVLQQLIQLTEDLINREK
ncbi:polyprenyl synthetase family protein [Anditalea andensis]|uniref:Isoprenyl synthetase n=1 Tax=Anditalea andensis TaxID=1048983 RepID=A0A074KYY2_9BACT|nr:polyprenyl synthetase family protein [Anditalea andensis]KEO72838.1 isoprenyl synthetase [Anditalea andensis]